MNSIKTKAKNYFKTSENHCISQVVAVAEDKGFRIYVAWESERMAEKGVYGITKSAELYPSIIPEYIKATADYGGDITGTAEAKKVFKNIL